VRVCVRERDEELVCVCERERESEYACACVCVRERDEELVCVCVREREREAVALGSHGAPTRHRSPTPARPHPRAHPSSPMLYENSYDL
jgi:hypothetical protein